MAFISVRTAELLSRQLRENPAHEPLPLVDGMHWINGRD